KNESSTKLLQHHPQPSTGTTTLHLVEKDYYRADGGPKCGCGGSGIGVTGAGLDVPPPGPLLGASSPGRRRVGAFTGLFSFWPALATVGPPNSTSFSVRRIFSPFTFMVSTRMTSSPTTRTKSTS